MVEARDLTEYKTGLIRENIERLGLANVRAVLQGCYWPDPEWHVKSGSCAGGSALFRPGCDGEKTGSEIPGIPGGYPGSWPPFREKF